MQESERKIRFRSQIRKYGEKVTRCILSGMMTRMTRHILHLVLIP